MPDKIVRLSQAAALLGVCATTLRAMVKHGDVRAVMLGRRWLGFELDELERFIRARTVQRQYPGDASTSTGLSDSDDAE